MAAVSLSGDTNMASVTSCENTLYGHLLRKALDLKGLANLTGIKGTMNGLLPLQYVSSYKAGVSNKRRLP